MTSLRSSIYGWNTQEPSVQSTEAVPEVQVPQEPSVQSSEENTLLDDVHVIISPLNSRPMEFTTSGMNSVSPSITYDNMILNRSFLKEPPIYLTTDPLSYPSLFSYKLSALSLSSNTERKHLVKGFLHEWQSPELEKGEVVMRKEILSLGEETLDIKSHEAVCARSDEITLQKQRDLGVLYNVVSGEQTSHSTEDIKDGNSSSDTSAEAATGTSFKNTFPQSLESLTDRHTKLESAMSKLTKKVEAMDSKLEKILSLLLPGHSDDAKKGENSNQSNPDDADPGNNGNRDKEATYDAAKNLAKQLTHVAGQGT